MTNVCYSFCFPPPLAIHNIAALLAFILNSRRDNQNQKRRLEMPLFRVWPDDALNQEDVCS
jgi:hypothetical protein